MNKTIIARCILILSILFIVGAAISSLIAILYSLILEYGIVGIGIIVGAFMLAVIIYWAVNNSDI